MCLKTPIARSGSRSRRDAWRHSKRSCARSVTRAESAGEDLVLHQEISAAFLELESIFRQQQAFLQDTAALAADLTAIRASEVGRVTETYRQSRSTLRRLATPVLGAPRGGNLSDRDRLELAESAGPKWLGSAGAARDQPTVSVLVLNLNGRNHLESCLPSLQSQTYSRDGFEIVVVDNGSTDGSLELVRECHPHVRIIVYGHNRGFAEAYNSAAGLCRTDFVAFLNNDTRVASDWLAELVAAAGRHAATSVASKIVDWDGERIDFAGGILSFVGHAWQRDAGQPATRPYSEDRLLFACGGSMLVRRKAFLDAGGFDPEFFAYFEDVDLGWRLSLLGHTTVFAPSAVTYHRLHGTAARWSLPPRLRLYERNALMMIYKNYEDETLARVLPVAIALAAARACTYTPLDPGTFAFGQPIPDRIGLSPRTIAHLIGLEDFASRLPALAKKRTEIQRCRRRSDAELLPLFMDPLRLHELGPVYEQLARTLMAEFEIDRWMDPSAVLSGSSRSRAQTMATEASAAPQDSAPVVPVTTADVPAVSVVILVAGGPAHLPDCLESLRAQTYPADEREVVVVDNNSAEDPAPVVERHYPGARVIRNASNLGFAAGNNVGLRAARGKYVAFLNDDTRVDPNWLTELVDVASRRRAACVASQILTWDGRRIDFTSGTVNFEGKGFHADHGRHFGGHSVERPLFFACGAAMLVDRDVLLNMGGWDEGTFAYYEDVELGWRFWLLGEEVWSAPKALVFHRHHGTSGRWAEAARVRLYERNSLRMVYTHLERHHLERVLPAALLLAADRALLQTGLGRSAIHEQASAQSPGPMRRLVRAGRGVPRRYKRALIARGAGRHLSPMENLRRLGVGGLLSAATSVIGQAVQDAGPAALHPRTAYLIEKGSYGGELDGRDESVPAAAVAALTGLQEFLSSLPEARAPPGLAAGSPPPRRRRHSQAVQSRVALSDTCRRSSGTQRAAGSAHRQVQPGRDCGSDFRPVLSDAAQATRREARGLPDGRPAAPDKERRPGTHHGRHRRPARRGRRRSRRR